MTGFERLDESYALRRFSKMFDAIPQAVKLHSHYMIKRNAVHAMTKIFKLFLRSTSTLGREIRSRSDCWDTSRFDDKFLNTLERFTADEKYLLITEDGGKWLEQYRVVVHLAEARGHVVSLREGLEMLEEYWEDLTERREGDYESDEEAKMKRMIS